MDRELGHKMRREARLASTLILLLGVLVFAAWPGEAAHADVALRPIIAQGELPGVQFSQPPACDVCEGAPQLWTVSQPYGRAGDAFTLFGSGLGDAPGRVTLDGRDLTIDTWSDTTIDVSIPPEFPIGPRQLELITADGQVAPTGLTFHVLGGRSPGGYEPTVLTVRQDGGGDYATIQEAINAAQDGADTLVVVYPGTYTENVILHKGLKLQGVGPGGPAGEAGAVLDGGALADQAPEPPTPLDSLPVGSTPEGAPPPMGATLTVVGEPHTHRLRFRSQIDGFYLTGGRGDEGGAIQIGAFSRGLIVSNNVIQSNIGGVGGAVAIGRAYQPNPGNQYISIHHNRILNNSGTRLAGAIGVFNGAARYDIHHNILCGNDSGEFGGGISHYGHSPGGRIHHNTIVYNSAAVAGGGILIGGGPRFTSRGSGRVDVTHNLILGNLADGDGGGVRLLQPATSRIHIANNVIVNNVATNMGGGISLRDASNVVIVNNTIAWNVSTSTAEGSDGRPHAAGLVAEAHSAPFQAQLQPDAPAYPDPVLFNNIFSNNIAYRWSGQFLEPVAQRDLEVFGADGVLHPHYCLLTVPYPTTATPPGQDNNRTGVPGFVDEYEPELSATTATGEAIIVTVELPAGVCRLPGDYRLQPTSQAIDAGAAFFQRIRAPSTDKDNRPRPQGAGYDIGAYEH
jgi:parallel beta-helix repeat protein